MGKCESARPNLGLAGMDFSCICNVMVVFQPEMYCEMSSRPMTFAAGPPKSRGAYMASTLSPALRPVVTDRSRAVACPSNEPFFVMWMSMYGIVAE